VPIEREVETAKRRSLPWVLLASGLALPLFLLLGVVTLYFRPVGFYRGGWWIGAGTTLTDGAGYAGADRSFRQQGKYDGICIRFGSAAFWAYRLWALRRR
jgi:hypothetical protein